jgi:hypothetical protein
VGIGWGIIDIFQGAIDGHQPQAKGEGARRVFGGQRHTRLFKEGAQEPHAELFAPIGPGRACGQRLGLFLAQPALSTTELEEDRAQAVAQIQVPTDEHPDHQHHRQLAGTGALATEGLDELLDALAGKELFQDRPREAVTEFVRAGQLRYSKGHEESPFDIPDESLFLSMSDAKLLFHLFKRYCPLGLVWKSI